MRLASRLYRHAEANRLGAVLVAETGYRISRDPDTVLAPDVPFVAREHVPSNGPPERYSDLAVEVLPPSDTTAEVQSKVQMWL